MAGPPSPKTLVRESYNGIAPSYLYFISTLPTPSIAWTDKLLSHLTSPADSTILELGCGNGIPCTAYLAPRVGKMVVNDISTAQIDIAREKLRDAGNVDFVVSDMTALDFEDGTFHAVVALYSLIHLPLEDQKETLRSIHRWSKPDGILLCNFDVEEDPGSVMDDWLGEKMFKAGFGVEGSKKVVEKAGFEILEAEVVEAVDGQKTVPFLWVLAKKSST